MQKCALVTGATDGIGLHTAVLLAKNSDEKMRLLLHGRDPERLYMARSRILELAPKTEIHTLCHDLSSLAGSKALAEEVLRATDQLDICVQNAGVFSDRFTLTPDNDLELTFAVNVAAPFILLTKLFPLLRVTPRSRMLMVSSISQADGGRLDMENLQLKKAGSWNKYSSYGQSKLMVAMLSAELSARVSPEEVTVFSCDPGTVNTKMLLAGWGRCGISVDNADDEFRLVSSPDPTMHGKYFVGCKESRCSPDVYDVPKRQRLWAELERITNSCLT
jgi:NAD(P)-dependent dehydrogenase (short-subunit alcohol dehydrogenase family)